MFIANELSVIYPKAFVICLFVTGDRAENVDYCLVLMALSSEDSFTCHTYCDTGPLFIQSHPKDRHPCSTVGFELTMEGSSDL
jgi:hypothetical protein